MSVLHLGLLGPKGKTAVPALRKALQDSDDHVAEIAGWALENVQTGETFWYGQAGDELTPERRALREARELERRARRVAVKFERLLDLSYMKPQAEIGREKMEYFVKRRQELDDELEEIACHCGDMSEVGFHLRVGKIRPHKKDCLYTKLFAEACGRWAKKWTEERARRVLEESRQ